MFLQIFKSGARNFAVAAVASNPSSRTRRSLRFYEQLPPKAPNKWSFEHSSRSSVLAPFAKIACEKSNSLAPHGSVTRDKSSIRASFANVTWAKSAQLQMPQSLPTASERLSQIRRREECSVSVDRMNI